jgi:AcrR family transcriptional regulator
VRTEGKRTAILETAAQAFMESGYTRTSMSEIVARLGGSKATLYGYFSSKEELFFDVVHYLVVGNLLTAFEDLTLKIDEDPRPVLLDFAERLLISVTSSRAIAARRMVIAEVGQSDIGQRFWASGPQRGLELVALYLAGATRKGRLKVKHPDVAAQHFVALTESEFLWRWLYGLQATFTRQEIKCASRRAVEVFLQTYGMPGCAQAPQSQSKRRTRSGLNPSLR